MSEWPTFIDPRDLAPGDLVPHKNLPSGIELCRIETSDDPLFELAYCLLEEEFGKSNEIETREVLIDRLTWRADRADEKGFVMRYELLVLKVAGEIAAVRDHSAIISNGEMTVHLSHVLVLPDWRRYGLATVLRTLPVTFARATAAIAGVPNARVTLFCEMELLNLSDPTNLIRRISYEKAGFLAISSGHGYLQPDFRAPSLIAADPEGSKPVPMDLLFRRIGREQESEMSGSELFVHLERIYQMFGRGISPESMAPCARWFESFRTVCPDVCPLLPPTAAK